mmetsp:Transcript_14805/g.43199  ORF Transcript_14805/g.43199 Transcript_14805/m.43199 type:complete len:234 (-) Transcript_14805:716-1417(-)
MLPDSRPRSRWMRKAPSSSSPPLASCSSLRPTSSSIRRPPSSSISRPPSSRLPSSSIPRLLLSSSTRKPSSSIRRLPSSSTHRLPSSSSLASSRRATTSQTRRHSYSQTPLWHQWQQQLPARGAVRRLTMIARAAALVSGALAMHGLRVARRSREIQKPGLLRRQPPTSWPMRPLGWSLMLRGTSHSALEELPPLRLLLPQRLRRRTSTRLPLWKRWSSPCLRQKRSLHPRLP